MNLKKYISKHFTGDILSGLSVSFAALSLGAAFGIQSGLGAFAGMMGAAVIPFIASLFGGTRIQASGPTAPMTAVSMLVIEYAFSTFTGGQYEALQFVTLVFILTGILLILFGVFQLGKLISKIPHLVIIGFMNGIAILIWIDQIKSLLGWGGKEVLNGGIGWNTLFAVLTFICILGLPFLFKKLKLSSKVKAFLPPTLLAIIIIGLIISSLPLDLAKVALGTTISSLHEMLFHVQHIFPTIQWTNSAILWKAFTFALQLAILGYLDSLLTGVVIDNMTKETSKRNKELIAQGLANGISGILGGIPGAQATIRSVLLIKEGAHTRLAGIFVALFTFLGMFLFSDILRSLSLCIFVGILLKVGLDVFDYTYLSDFIKNKWYMNKERIIQFLFMVYTVCITIFINLNIAVISATILFYIVKYFGYVIDIEQQEDTSLDNED